MDLQALADEFIAQRSASGLFVSEPQVLQCLVDAARFYMGWQPLRDQTASSLETVAADTDLDADEWAIVAPLFRLYVERETALILEASRGLGAELVGRSSSEVASEIANVESLLPQQAFQEDAFSAGFPD